MAVGEREHFLAHAIELESEALQRYQELADAMAVHNNPAVAAFFNAMVRESTLHCQKVTALAAGLVLPDIKAWEFEWPEAESPESVEYEAVHYRMSERAALQLALDNEFAARDFYQSWADRCEDSTTREWALEFSAEEADHARQLQQLMASLDPETLYQQEDDDPPHMPE
jgi:rubrerythrin